MITSQAITRSANLGIPISAHFLNLPIEVHLLIIDQSDLNDVVTLAAVCHGLKDIIKDSSIVQLRLESAKSGYDYRPSGHHTVQQSLEVLQEHRTAINSLELIETRMHMKLSFRIAFSAGTLATITPGKRSIHFVDLPSVKNGTPERIWKHEDVGVPISCFFIDREQDLLLILEDPSGPTGEVPCFHVRSLSTAAVHPRAFEPQLKISNRRMTWKTCEPQVLGHTLGALFRSYESDRAIFAIWSWTRPMGIMIYHGGVGEAESAILLSSDTFLVTKRDICKSTLAFIELHRIVPVGNSGSVIRCIASFQLPLLNPDRVTNSSLSMHSVLPSRSPVGSGHPDPFKAFPDNRVILVKWDIATTVPSGSSRDAIIRIIIPASVFLDSSHCLLNPTTPIRPIPKQWDEWGPQNTRMFYSDHTPNSDRTTVGLAGPRVIQMSDTHDGECVSVLDFTKNAAMYWKTNAEVVASELNHNGIWWCRAKEAHDGHLSYVVPRTLPTIIINPVFAGGKIETSLPYCVSSKVIAQDRRRLGPVRGIRAGDEQFVRFYTPNLLNPEMELVIWSME